MMKWLVTLLPTFTFALSVTIINDSPFPLHAQVLAATGDLLGSMTMQPQEQIHWQNSDVGNNNLALVPLSVIFYCLEGTEYGIATDVPTGAGIYASSASGSRMCKPQTPALKKQEEKEKKENPQLENVNPDQWHKQDYQ